MYSRKFSQQVELPAGYGGVALREVQGTQRQTEEERQRASDPLPDPALPYKEEPSCAQAASGREGRYDRVLCRPRRPLYRDERRHPPRHRDSSLKEECDKSKETKGLLSSLFSLSGKSFTMEDIILAGLILLLLSEKEKGGRVDNELLLILGFLLLGGR